MVFFAFQKSLDDLGKAEEACSKLGSGGPFASCIHGIGHGIASFHSTNDLKASLKACRKLITGREFCFDGVFMEFVRSAPAGFFKKDDPLFPCDSLEKDFGYSYSFSCGRNQPSLLMGRFNMGFDGVIAVCRSSSSTPFKQACFDALGFSLAATMTEPAVTHSNAIIETLAPLALTAATGEVVARIRIARTSP